MHEMSLFKPLITRIEQIAEEESSPSIAAATVRLGAFAPISPDHFKEHWNEFTKGTVAEGATLTLVRDENEMSPRAQDIVLESVEIEEG
ncbi:hydrogenase maturation nickel metallochaperone HypA [bacterium]|nr:hydrogenase maturation nickel metallochaperone HypA [bacterium]